MKLYILGGEKMQEGEWVEDLLNAGKTIPEGTAIATFVKGRYPNVRLDASETRECRARWRQHGKQVTLLSFGCD